MEEKKREWEKDIQAIKEGRKTWKTDRFRVVGVAFNSGNLFLKLEEKNKIKKFSDNEVHSLKEEEWSWC